MFENISNAGLVDIRDVNVDRALPQGERVIDYVRQIVDPHHFMCDELDVTLIFADVGPSFEDCLKTIMT
jgi:hypothetical protein